MNQLNQRLVAAEQVEGDEGRASLPDRLCPSTEGSDAPATIHQAPAPLSLHAAATFLSCVQDLGIILRQ